MQKDERDLLEVLKFELEFLEKGGYGRSPREPWRPLYIFEDSPTCMNYDSKESPGPCSECVLMRLVPPALRAEKIPCRHILLSEAGETLDSMYRWSDEHEIEETVDAWLKRTIANLEVERQNVRHEDIKQGPLNSEILQGTPLNHNLHPKCANPVCAKAFRWLEGGKFFRFRPEPEKQITVGRGGVSLDRSDGVKHYWLCEHCSNIFTLVYEEDLGVVLTLKRLELSAPEPQKELASK